MERDPINTSSPADPLLTNTERPSEDIVSTTPDTMEVGSQATTPLAPAQDTIIPTQSTPDKAGQGVGDAINSPDMEITPSKILWSDSC